VPAPFDAFVVTPERMVWSGRATLIVARGTEGEVGVMNGHVPMLLQIAISALFIDTEAGDRLAIAVDGGFLHVITRDGETRVDVLAESAELRDEIDVDRERRRKEAAERRASDHDGAEALGEIAKANVRLGLRS
jgi:F-type H+-transporting ATPase subunit epsilon